MELDYSSLKNFNLLKSAEKSLRDTKELKKDITRLRDELKPGFEALKARQMCPKKQRKNSTGGG
jgi:hypothetical protein